MNIKKERADFEAFASKHGLCVTEDGDLYRSHVVAWMWEAWQARAALQTQSMPPEISRDLLGKIVDEVFDGAIEDAGVIEDIYRVVARECALQSQDREDAERYRWLRDSDGLHDLPYEDHGLGPEFPSGEALDAAIDRARRIEGQS